MKFQIKFLFLNCDPEGLQPNSPEIFKAINNDNIELVNEYLNGRNTDLNRMIVFHYYYCFF